jgi:hypothetical protein
MAKRRGPSGLQADWVSREPDRPVGAACLNCGAGGSIYARRSRQAKERTPRPLSFASIDISVLR